MKKNKPSKAGSLPHLNLWIQCKPQYFWPAAVFKEKKGEKTKSQDVKTFIKEHEKPKPKRVWYQKRNFHLYTHLGKRLLTVVFQVLRINIKVVVVDGVRLSVFWYARYKFFYFKCDWGFSTAFKLLHGNVRWIDIIWKIKNKQIEEQNQTKFCLFTI